MFRETDSTSDEVEVKKQLEDLYGDGFRSIAVCLIHGYDFQGKLSDLKCSLDQMDSHSYHLEQNTRKALDRLQRPSVSNTFRYHTLFCR